MKSKNHFILFLFFIISATPSYAMKGWLSGLGEGVADLTKKTTTFAGDTTITALTSARDSIASAAGAMHSLIDDPIPQKLTPQNFVANHCTKAGCQQSSIWMIRKYTTETPEFFMTTRHHPSFNTELQESHLTKVSLDNVDPADLRRYIEAEKTLRNPSKYHGSDTEIFFMGSKGDSLKSAFDLLTQNRVVKMREEKFVPPSSSSKSRPSNTSTVSSSSTAPISSSARPAPLSPGEKERLEKLADHYINQGYRLQGYTYSLRPDEMGLVNRSGAINLKEYSGLTPEAREFVGRRIEAVGIGEQSALDQFLMGKIYDPKGWSRGSHEATSAKIVNGPSGLAVLLTNKYGDEKLLEAFDPSKLSFEPIGIPGMPSRKMSAESKLLANLDTYTPSKKTTASTSPVAKVPVTKAAAQPTTSHKAPATVSTQKPSGKSGGFSAALNQIM